MLISRIAHIATAAALVATVGFFGATSASATVVGGGGCGGGTLGHSFYNVPSGTWEKVVLSNGTLLAEYVADYSGINVEYQKSGGSTITADFIAYPFDTYEIKDTGAFAESTGQVRSYEWTKLGLVTGTCTEVGIDVVGQGDLTFDISSS